MKCKEMACLISDWMKSYATECGADGFVVGISGGIDSALVSTLAARTGMKTLCTTLSIHQPVAHVDRAEEHIDWLMQSGAQVMHESVDLTDAYDAFAASMPESGDPARRALALANSRSRLRMTALYYLACRHSMLVAGTGNKIEDFGIGFFTKYGDGGVDLSPIGDLTKSEVYELSRYLGVCRSILEAPPTDGLFADDRSDEQQIGATYPELEHAMRQYESGVDSTELVGREAEVYGIFRRRHLANRHKVEPIPLCLIPSELKR